MLLQSSLLGTLTQALPTLKTITTHICLPFLLNFHLGSCPSLTTTLVLDFPTGSCPSDFYSFLISSTLSLRTLPLNLSTFNDNPSSTTNPSHSIFFVSMFYMQWRYLTTL
ncbi:hypothetical protein DFJ73DRAFT_854438 [Zopfochytrium polystomum]|nr:hypothetical protein DFJ73DRAFT_854438 [Zopfochytrium polystomum]